MGDQPVLRKVHFLLRGLALLHLVAGSVAFWLFVADPHLHSPTPPTTFIAFMGAFGIAVVTGLGDVLVTMVAPEGT
jgi:hypothetical protein